jgi:CelD/BcsL family acetyltransferase involved in cellulose biosynthesis
MEKQPEFIGSQKNPFHCLPCIPNASSAHYAHLGDSLETFLQTRRGNRWLSGERRKERRLGEHGVLGYHVAKSLQDVKRLLPEMMAQKSQSYQEMGVRDLF